MQPTVSPGPWTTSSRPASPPVQTSRCLPVDGLPCGCVLHLQPRLPEDVNDCVVPQKVTWNTRDKWAQLYAKTPVTYAKAEAQSGTACREDVLMPPCLGPNPGSGGTFLYLSPPLCKVGTIVIATSRVAVGTAGTALACSEGSVCPMA